MTEVVVKISEDLERRMKELPVVDWSSVVRVLIRGEVSRLALLKSVVSRSKLTEKDALELGKKVNASLAKRYNKLLEEGEERGGVVNAAGSGCKCSICCVNCEWQDI